MIYIYFIIFNGGEAPAASHVLLVKDKKLKQTSRIISVIVVANQISVLFFGILAENNFNILAQSPRKSLNALSRRVFVFGCDVMLVKDAIYVFCVYTFFI